MAEPSGWKNQGCDGSNVLILVGFWWVSGGFPKSGCQQTSTQETLSPVTVMSAKSVRLDNEHSNLSLRGLFWKDELGGSQANTNTSIK